MLILHTVMTFVYFVVCTEWFVPILSHMLGYIIIQHARNYIKDLYSAPLVVGLIQLHCCYTVIDYPPTLFPVG